MSGIGEVQTVSAVFDLLKLAVAAGKFLKKVKDADKIAGEVHERVERLTQVLDGVRAVILKRRQAGASSTFDDDTAVESRINQSARACYELLRDLEQKVGGFEKQATSFSALVERVKIALRQPIIVKRQTDLEARISILQTELVVLQL